MKKTIIVVVGTVVSVVTMAVSALHAENAESVWYRGDEHCPPPSRTTGTYSAPYNPREHQHDYPIFPGADRPGWSCSYTRQDGAIVQYGDSRSPQQQWLAVWGDLHNHD